MPWYDHTVQSFEPGRIYSYQMLMQQIRQSNPGISDSSSRWAIDGLLKDGVLRKNGYDEYVVATGASLPEYRPAYSETALALTETLSQRFPRVPFTVFETVLLNEFLNHLIAQNTLFIHAEKESSIFLFRYLQEQGQRGLLYKPSKRDYSLYWEKDTIVVADLTTEAPLRADAPHAVCLEKLLVDIYADKLISTTYSKAEYPSVLEQAMEHYRLDRAKMLRYARRRNKEEGLRALIERENQDHVSS